MALILLHLSELGNAPARHPPQAAPHPPSWAWRPRSPGAWASRRERGTIWSLGSPWSCPPGLRRVPAAGQEGAGRGRGVRSPRWRGPGEVGEGNSWAPDVQP